MCGCVGGVRPPCTDTGAFFRARMHTHAIRRVVGTMARVAPFCSLCDTVCVTCRPRFGSRFACFPFDLSDSLLRQLLSEVRRETEALSPGFLQPCTRPHCLLPPSPFSVLLLAAASLLLLPAFEAPFGLCLPCFRCA